MNMYGRYNYWQSLYEKNWTFTFYCHKNFVNCSNFWAVFIFYLTARIRLNLIRAVKIFLSSSWHLEKKCRAVEIRADGFRAVHPDSFERENWLFKQNKRLKTKSNHLCLPLLFVWRYLHVPYIMSRQFLMFCFSNYYKSKQLVRKFVGLKMINVFR